MVRRLLPFALVASGCSVATQPVDEAPAASPPASETPSSPAPEADAPADAPPPAAPDALSDVHPSDVTLEHDVTTLEGEPRSLKDYRGKALMVVNTASECGHTPQYAGLQELYGKYEARGFEILAFPSNDFGGQEPGTPAEIRAFVDEEFHVEFPIFAKVHAKGPGKSELFTTLTEQTGEGIRGEIEWNFTKFLVDVDGHVVARFPPGTQPGDPAVVAAIERILP